MTNQKYISLIIALMTGVFPQLMLSLDCIADELNFTFVENGSSKITVVYNGDSSSDGYISAHILGDYVAKMTGTNIGYKNGGTSSRNAIYIGDAVSSIASDVPGPSYGLEAYKISVRTNNVNHKNSIYLNGNSPEAIKYAVYSFIEDIMGVRWFAPGDDWEYVPDHPGNLSLTVASTGIIEPSVSPRIWSGNNTYSSWSDWNKFNKNKEGSNSKSHFANEIHTLFPPSEFGTSHPEYYPLINGQRYIPSAGAKDWWPCTSNIDVQDLTIDRIINWFDANPDEDSFGLGMDDTYNICQCGPCATMDSSPDDYEYKRFSDRHFKFINIVAKGVKLEHPDKYIGTLMYWVTRELPTTMPVVYPNTSWELEDNVVGYITEESAAHYDSNILNNNQSITEDWAARASHISRYEYMGLSTFVPRVYPRHMAEAMAKDRDEGVQGMYMEVYTFLPHTAPMVWACSKLQWDENLDIDDLLDEFYSKMFGSVADDMKDYFELLEDAWDVPRVGHDTPNEYGANQMTMDTWVHKDIQAQASSISSQTLQDGMTILNAAYNAASSTVIQDRIDIIRGGLEFASFAVIPYNDSVALSHINVESLADCTDIFESAEDIADKLNDCPAVWSSMYSRQDLLGETIRKYNSATPDPTKLNTLATGVFTAVNNAFAWLEQNAPSSLGPLYLDLMTNLPSGFVKDGIQSVKWVRDNTPTNLALNGSFEANHYDHWDNAIATDWTVWSRFPNRRHSVWEDGGAIDNGHCLKLETQGDDLELMIQQLPNVQPGEEYVVKVWAKPFAADTAMIKIRYKNSSNGWLSPADNDIAIELLGSPSPQWKEHVLYTKIPSGATKLAVQLGSLNQTQVRFDEVQIYKIP